MMYCCVVSCVNNLDILSFSSLFVKVASSVNSCSFIHKSINRAQGVGKKYEKQHKTSHYLLAKRFKMMAKTPKGLAPNPASLSDDQIIDKVYKTHVPGEKYDVIPLWNVAFNIVKRSTEIADSIILKVITHILCLNSAN